MRSFYYILICLCLCVSKANAQFPHTVPKSFERNPGMVNPVILYSLHGGDDYSSGFGFGAGAHYYPLAWMGLRTRAMFEWNTLVPAKDQLHPNSDATMLRVPLEVMVFPGTPILFAYAGAAYQKTLSLRQFTSLPTGYSESMMTYSVGAGTMWWGLGIDLGLYFSAYEKPGLRLMLMYELVTD